MAPWLRSCRPGVDRGGDGGAWGGSPGLEIHLPVDDEHRPSLHLVIDPPDVLPDQSERQELDSRAEGDHQDRSEEHTSELQSLAYLVCRLLLEKKKHKENTSRKTTDRDKQTSGVHERTRC